ncbi:MAG: hypothetical protein ACRC1X_06875 [Lactobacillus panisapium]|uniref:hypothetical protein n=1 Tax=Lactobacillus TaxID=1578 RepID=UPI00226B745A|nr:MULTISPECIES: hypothetical protein [Lactobacillus]MCX8737279.1 hypothetical protein [Lactobacillus sp. B4026]
MADKKTAKSNSELALEAHQKQVKSAKDAESSTIASMMGKTKTIVVAQDTDHEYSLTLQFPGVARAMEIEDIASNQYGNMVFSLLMKEAIKDVIVSPKINSLDFWDTHAGLGEVTIQVLTFLNDGINGEIK